MGMPYRQKWCGTLVAALAFSFAASAAHAETRTVRVAKQFGVSYLPLSVMEEKKLIESEGKKLGLDLNTEWLRFTGGPPMNEAIVSGNLDFASGGVGPLVTAWARTTKNIKIKGIAAINAMPLFLNTIKPEIKTIKDFTEKDRIALPAVKVSIQAVTLQMAAEKVFGSGQQNKLDHLTVSMSHPDAETALLAGRSEITAHLGSPPFQYQELEQKGMHRVLNSYDVLGGPATFNVVWTTKKFHDENPGIYAAFVAALDDATAQINRDKKKAAETYLRVSKDKDSLEDILKMLNDPEIKYTTTPNNTMKYVDFMHKVGSIKAKPDSWKEMYFPNAQKLSGS